MPQEMPKEKKALDLSGELVGVEGAETDEELLLGRELLGALIKAIKAFRFYPADNPALKGFKDQLLKKLQSFLRTYHLFVFQIEEYTLSFKSKMIYENRDAKTSLAFFFYKDGLREMRFVEGVEEWEIEGLVELIRQSDNINQLEDDLVTLLWEKDFAHISYLATDEFLEEMPVCIPETVDEFRQNVVSEPLVHQVGIDGLENLEHAGLNGLFSKVNEKRPFSLSARSVYSLTPDEVERLRSEVESEIAPSFVFSIIDILFEILALEKDPEPYQTATGILDKVLDAFLTLGEFQKASDLLKRIYLILKTSELKDWQTDIMRKWIIRAGEERRIERIGKVLEKEEGVRLEDLSGYLILLQRNSIKPLVKLLGDLNNSKARRMICDILSQVGKNASEMFIPFMEDHRWYLVRNIVYILGQIGKEEFIPHLQKVINHEEPRVRREAAQALGLIGGPIAVELLSKAIEDNDVRVRAVAALNLAKVGKKDGLGLLLEVIQSKEFPKREPAEIKAFFSAIGMTGSSESIPVLRQLLERKSWFTRGKTDYLRIGAASALAALDSSEAKAILKSGMESKDESIRNACFQVLRGRPA